MVRDLFTLSISTGMISELERQSAAALEAPFNELATSIHQAEVTNIDETSWGENRRKVWLLATVTGLITVFTIATNRSREIAAASPGKRRTIRLSAATASAFMSGSMRPVDKFVGHICVDFQAMIDRRVTARDSRAIAFLVEAIVPPMAPRA